MATRLPVLDRLFADLHGRVWIRLFDPEAGESRRWVLLDDKGRDAGQLELPERFEPLDASEEYALFRTRDDLDVERLVLYWLNEPDA